MTWGRNMAGSYTGGKPTLSPQEIACLELLAIGCTNKEAAKKLGLSPATVASYLQSIYQKLGTQTRGHAIAVALQNGLIHPTDRD